MLSTNTNVKTVKSRFFVGMSTTSRIRRSVSQLLKLLKECSVSVLLAILLAASLSSSHAQINGEFESSVITKNTFIASSFINDNEGWLADNKGMLWHTGNAGQTWDSTLTEKYFLKLDFTGALTGFAISPNAAYKTTDGGHSWTALSLPGSIGKAISFLNNEVGFVSGYNETYKTTDGGTTWTSIATDDVSFVDYFFVNNSVGIATANGDDDYKCIWRTGDGGLTWTNVYQEENNVMNSVWFINENTGWAAGYYDQTGVGREPQIIQTTDGGLTWQSVYRNPEIVGRGESLLDIRFRNESEGLAISNYSESVYTTDGGQNWNRIYETEILGLPSLQGIYKTLSGNSDMYLAGSFGYVVKWK